MHAKVPNLAFWAFTIAILLHLGLTANAGPVSFNDLSPIEKRSDGSKIEKRYFDNKKFVYDSGEATSKRSSIFQELASSFKKRSPITWSTTGRTTYFFGASCNNGVCHKARSLETKLKETQLKKRSPVPSNVEESSGSEIETGSLRRTIDDLADEMTSVLLSRNLPWFGSMFRWWPGAHRRRYESDLDQESTVILTKRWRAWFLNRFKPGGRRKRSLEFESDEALTSIITKRLFPWWFNRFAPAGGGARREEFTSDEALTSMLTKRWLPWWSRFFSSGSGTRREELTSDEALTSMLTKRWIPWWLNRFAPSGGGARREELTSDEALTNMLTKRLFPWWFNRFAPAGGGARREELISDEALTSMLTRRLQAPPRWVRSLSGARKSRDGLAFYDEELTNDQRRSGDDERNFLFTERWVAGMDSGDELVEQVKRSPILGPLFMYWTIPIRRSFEGELQTLKREPVPAGSSQYRPNNHRRSSEAETERQLRSATDQPHLVKRKEQIKEEEVKREISSLSSEQQYEESIVRSLNSEKHMLVKREPGKGKPTRYHFGLPRRALDEKSAKVENLVKREPVWNPNRYVFAPPRRSLDEKSAKVENLVKREPVWNPNRYAFAPPRRSLDEKSAEVENLVKREPIFRYNRNNFGGAPPVSRSSEEEESLEIQKRQPVQGGSKGYNFGHKRSLQETASSVEVREPAWAKPNSYSFGGRDSREAQTSKGKQISKRSPIFSVHRYNFGGRDSDEGESKIAEREYGEEAAKREVVEKQAGNDEQISRRSPIFMPKGPGYYGTQKNQPTKREDSDGAKRRNVGQTSEVLANANVKREIFDSQAGNGEQVSKRSPIFNPKSHAYMGFNKVSKNLKTENQNDP
ncbi:uncharacterized protein FA14DRAFT_155093 [Meira miltonrushii]|uniref:Uncharacterized protein n=1 Tax=Meira miltonrushii TaxID=1280837 RepID=A0A316VEF7_9BASI|nr:uncharacterized protein FA14DRAFT_155093 [Meira miltonrushii]PWN35684.1 hypothetical protein FA14DRAFT_155093 [Meira miltonrushii]